MFIDGAAKSKNHLLSTHETSRTALLGKGLYKESMLSELWSPPQITPDPWLHMTNYDGGDDYHDDDDDDDDDDDHDD